MHSKFFKAFLMTPIHGLIQKPQVEILLWSSAPWTPKTDLGPSLCFWQHCIPPKWGLIILCYICLLSFPAWLCCYSVAISCPTLCDSIDCSTPGFPDLCYLPELAQTRVLWLHDAIQPSHPLSPPCPPAFNLSQHPGLFQWVSSSHQVAKVLDLQL